MLAGSAQKLGCMIDAYTLARADYGTSAALQKELLYVHGHVHVHDRFTPFGR
jgi:hypothetical protein